MQRLRSIIQLIALIIIVMTTITPISSLTVQKPPDNNINPSAEDVKKLFNVRTITCFVEFPTLFISDNNEGTGNEQQEEILYSAMERTIAAAAKVLTSTQDKLSEEGYLVQTCRLVTNPFPEWMPTKFAINDDDEVDTTSLTAAKTVIARLDRILEKNGIEFCALGPANHKSQLMVCRAIVAQSHRLSCSAHLEPCDAVMARAAAKTIHAIANLDDGSHVQDGLGNFRFCVSHAKGNIPFFPVAYTSSTPSTTNSKGPNDSSSIVGVAVGLENGKLAHRLLSQCGSLQNVPTVFRSGMNDALQPLEQVVISHLQKISSDEDSMRVDPVSYLGMDTSLNPSLDGHAGSVAAALEQLEEVTVFGGPGSLAAAAAITTVLQSLDLQRLVGYCGLMLPVCEDVRLVELAEDSNSRQLKVADLLSISHVCGVGVDTVPIADSTPVEALTGLLLDVAGLAARWQKSLSCRVFPVPGKQAGDTTTFDSPYMKNAKIFSLE